MNDLSETDIAIYDESHYVGADKWFDAFMALRDVSGCLSIGVTATPQRFKDQGTNRTIVDLFGGNSAGNYTLNQLQRKGVFIEPEYVVSLASMEEEMEDLTISACCAHCRRKYDEALKALPKSEQKLSQTYIALSQIWAIYYIPRRGQAAEYAC